MRVFALLLLTGSLPATAATPVGVDSWAYQLQAPDPDEIAADATHQLIVMDYSRSGDESGEFSFAEIETIRASGKYAIAYISIGEAENYRFYWQPEWETSPPPWLGPENPDWPGNFKVRYWMEDWQRIIESYLDRIVAQGFDGIYMDIIDAYYYWSEEVGEKPDADALMVEFVAHIRNYLGTHHHRPRMVVIPQNGSFLIEEDDVTAELRSLYMRSIDALGVEDLFYFGDADENNPLDPDPARIAMVQQYRAAGNCVYSIDYLTEQEKIDDYTDRAKQEGFYPYTSVRPLDVLTPGIPTAFPVEMVPDGANDRAALSLAKSAGGLLLEWGGVCSANEFAIHRGTLAAIDIGNYDHFCEQDGITATWDEVADTPGSFYYLVSARNELGRSRLGRSSSGLERPGGASCTP